MEYNYTVHGDFPIGEWGEPAPVRNSNPPIHDLVIRDIESRKAMGYNKYGTFLQKFNGRDALKDAYEEALDLVCYLKQKLEEENDAGSSKT